MLLFWDNAIRINLSCKELGVLLQLFSLNLGNVYVNSVLEVDLFLDKNLSAIANMSCFDIAKPIVNAFLKASKMFFPAASINFIYIL